MVHVISRSLLLPLALPLGLSSALVLLTIARPAHAETYRVGPDKEYASLHEVVGLLVPGDIVEVDGGATYDGDLHIRADNSGTPDAKVTVRGIAVDGQRPVIDGGVDFGVVLNASHFVFEGFEITGASNACLIHKADDVTVRDVIVHDCPNHGILGTDFESGSLTIEFSEVYGCGADMYEHQIYIATDETMYPGSVFRLQHSYVHDGNGGNDVKTRAERNEIYCNWIESPAYHVLDLVPPDGQEPSLAREDADVVGNVLIQDTEWYIARMGSDYEEYGTNGRFRFAHNTIVSSAAATAFFRLQYELESASFYDNVFMTSDGAALPIVHDDDAWWSSGEQLAGANNFLASNLESPAFLSGSVTGDPAFANDFVPSAESPLVDRGGSNGMGPAGYEMPNGWAVPNCVPPNGFKNDDLAPYGRLVDGVADIGAFELGTTFAPGPGPGPGPGTDDDDGGSGGSSSDDHSDGGCAISAVSRDASTAAPLALLLIALVARSHSRSRRN